MSASAQPSSGTQSQKRFCTVAETALLLRLSEPTIYRAIHAGEFPAVKIRGRFVIPARALDEMESRALETGSVVDSASWAIDLGDAA